MRRHGCPTAWHHESVEFDRSVIHAAHQSAREFSGGESASKGMTVRLFVVGERREMSKDKSQLCSARRKCPHCPSQGTDNGDLRSRTLVDIMPVLDDASCNHNTTTMSPSVYVELPPRRTAKRRAEVAAEAEAGPSSRPETKVCSCLSVVRADGQKVRRTGRAQLARDESDDFESDSEGDEYQSPTERDDYGDYEIPSEVFDDYDSDENDEIKSEQASASRVGDGAAAEPELVKVEDKPRLEEDEEGAEPRVRRRRRGEGDEPRVRRRRTRGEEGEPRVRRRWGEDGEPRAPRRRRARRPAYDDDDNDTYEEEEDETPLARRRRAARRRGYASDEISEDDTRPARSRLAVRTSADGDEYFEIAPNRRVTLRRFNGQTYVDIRQVCGVACVACLSPADLLVLRQPEDGPARADSAGHQPHAGTVETAAV